MTYDSELHSDLSMFYPDRSADVVGLPVELGPREVGFGFGRCACPGTSRTSTLSTILVGTRGVISRNISSQFTDASISVSMAGIPVGFETVNAKDNRRGKSHLIWRVSMQC